VGSGGREGGREGGVSEIKLMANYPEEIEKRKAGRREGGRDKHIIKTHLYFRAISKACSR